MGFKKAGLKGGRNERLIKGEILAHWPLGRNHPHTREGSLIKRTQKSSTFLKKLLGLKIFSFVVRMQGSKVKLFLSIF